MQYVVETTFDEFQFWGGAVPMLDLIRQREDIEEFVIHELEEICDNQTMTETDVNDWLWFECEQFLEELGWTYDYDNVEWIHNED